MANIDPKIISEFKSALKKAYGERVERAVLYGSRARGDHQPDSDYDVAVFIHDHRTFGEEARRLADITTDILIDTGADISALPFPAGAWRNRTGFMHEVRKDGIDL